MIKSGHEESKLPLVPWQSDVGSAFKLFRLESKRGQKPTDGHNPGVPHRIGFHAIFLVTGGSFDHWMDFKTHRLKKNQLVYIAPNQIHHFMRSERPKSSWALIFQPELLPEGLLSKATNHDPSWSVVSYLWPSLTTLEESEAKLLGEQLNLIDMLEKNATSSQSTAAKHHVCGFITSAFELASKHSENLTSWQANERFLEFVQLAEAHFAVRRDVKWYANQLDCSDRTLNRTCRENTGKSAKAFLTERVIVEAKRILTQSVEPVSAVAEALGLGETTNFVRLFKHETGMTPLAFRTID